MSYNALNSSDLLKMRLQPDESEQSHQEAPSVEAVLTRQQQLEARLAEIELAREAERKAFEERDKVRDQRIHKLLDENNKREEILKADLARRAQQQTQETPKPSQLDGGGMSWSDILGIETQTEEPQVADATSQPKYYTDADIDRKIEEKQREREEAARKQQEELSQKARALAQDFRDNQKDISGNPALTQFFETTANEIHQLNPNVGVEQAYKLALEKTRQTASIFGNPGRQAAPRQQQQTASPYTLPSQPQTAAPQRQDNNPWGNYVETGTQEQVLAARRKEIEANQKAFKAKFK